MRRRPPISHDPSLSFEEKVKAAYLHFCKGMDQHTIAEIVFDGINQGRVNEACVAVEKALRASDGGKRKLG